MLTWRVHVASSPGARPSRRTPAAEWIGAGSRRANVLVAVAAARGSPMMPASASAEGPRAGSGEERPCWSTTVHVVTAVVSQPAKAVIADHGASTVRPRTRHATSSPAIATRTAMLSEIQPKTSREVVPSGRPLAPKWVATRLGRPPRPTSTADVVATRAARCPPAITTRWLRRRPGGAAGIGFVDITGRPPGVSGCRRRRARAAGRRGSGRGRGRRVQHGRGGWR